VSGALDIVGAREAERAAAAAQLASEAALRDSARAVAAAEQSYRLELAKAITRIHAEGVAWSSTADLARGNERVAGLRYARDVAQGVHEAAQQAAFRHGADRRALGRLIEWSARIDLRSNGETEQPFRLAA